MVRFRPRAGAEAHGALVLLACGKAQVAVGLAVVELIMEEQVVLAVVEVLLAALAAQEHLGKVLRVAQGAQVLVDILLAVEVEVLAQSGLLARLSLLVAVVQG